MKHTNAPSLEALRHEAQLAFVASGENLLVGRPQDLPLPLDELLKLDEHSACVASVFDGGLTARVFKVSAAGRFWTVKRARTEALVRNVDGQTSFLNEVQRRADVEALKRAPGGQERWRSLVDTCFASYRDGLMVSPWIEGEVVRDWNERRIAQVLHAACDLWTEGLFEWDLCPGNILDDGHQIRLFDFGYMYRFDPLQQFNSAGHGNDVPMFHPAERFETRNYSAVLLHMELEHGSAVALQAFREEKRLAREAYLSMRARIANRGAATHVLDWLDRIIARWSEALAASAEALFLEEAWRSHALDLDDDLRGQSCTPMTLHRADWLLQTIERHYDVLANCAAPPFANAPTPGKDQLLSTYRQLREQAQRYQIHNHKTAARARHI